MGMRRRPVGLLPDCDDGRLKGENEASSHCGRGCSVKGGGIRNGASNANGESP